MKPRNRQSRSLSVPSSRWLAYAVAGLATASGGAISAEAEIHYSGKIYYQLPRGNHALPLSGGASVNFMRTSCTTFIYDKMWIINAQTEGIATNPRHYALKAAKLHRGLNVSSWKHFDGFGALISCSGYGEWHNKGQAFAAFKFDTGRGTQYGWVRVRVTVPAPHDQMVIVDYAWADPGEPILTGQVPSEAAKPHPAEGSLGLLALGAAGLTAWRKSRFGKVNSAVPQ